MNNIRSLIPAILGSFWDTVFKGSRLVAAVKDMHYNLSKRLYKYVYSLVKGSSCNTSSSSYIYDQISVPVDSCILSTDTIGSYAFVGSVYKQAPVRTLMIPTSIIGKPYVVSSGYEWVAGINMDVNDSYVILYIPDKVDVTTDVRHISGSLVNSYVFKVGIKSDIPIYKNYSELIGVDMDRLPDTVRKSIWRSSVCGMHQSDMNSLLSYLIGNNVSESDARVTDIWKECDRYMISTDVGNVYSGIGIPIVKVGDKLGIGDLLFYGLHIFNRDKLPHASYIPSITINTKFGDILARNTETSPIETDIDYIPDMCNDRWADALCKDTKRSIMLKDGDNINTLHYAISRLLPVSSCIYSLPDVLYASTDIAGTITEHVYRSVLSSDISPMYRHIESDPMDITIKSQDPEVSIFLASPAIHTNTSISNPIVRVI